jgi:hypothetical protein
VVLEEKLQAEVEVVTEQVAELVLVALAVALQV